MVGVRICCALAIARLNAHGASSSSSFSLWAGSNAPSFSLSFYFLPAFPPLFFFFAFPLPTLFAFQFNLRPRYYWCVSKPSTICRSMLERVTLLPGRLNDSYDTFRLRGGGCCVHSSSNGNQRGECVGAWGIDRHGQWFCSYANLSFSNCTHDNKNYIAGRTSS